MEGRAKGRSGNAEGGIKRRQIMGDDYGTEAGSGSEGDRIACCDISLVSAAFGKIFTAEDPVLKQGFFDRHDGFPCPFKIDTGFKRRRRTEKYGRSGQMGLSGKYVIGHLKMLQKNAPEVHC